MNTEDVLLRLWCWSQETDVRTEECLASQAKQVKKDLEEYGYIVWHTEVIQD